MRVFPVYSPMLTHEDVTAVATAVSEGFISSSAPLVARFEKLWAERCGMPHAVAVSSGTAALELAVSALGLGPGDEVLCPAFTIISCVRAIVVCGATPVLVDVDPRTWCLDVDHAAARIGPRTRGVLAVHAFGNPYDHFGVLRLARTHALCIIEDAAQAHGARVCDGDALLPCGSLGDVSTFSFYANKAVTTGEGGMLLARDERIIERVRDLSNLFMRGERRFLHEELGHNYRFSSLQAALGISQLRRLDRTLEAKRRIFVRYREHLGKMEEIELQEMTTGSHPGYWMNGIVLSDRVPADASAVAAALRRRGVETRPFFVGFHEQPASRSRGLFENEHYPVTERLSRRGLYLPSGLDLDEGAIDHIVGELRNALSELAGTRVVVPREVGDEAATPDHDRATEKQEKIQP